MAKSFNRDEEKVIQSFRCLTPAKKRRAIDYLDHLASEKKTKDWVEFDVWASNLAKKKDFDRLTEEDITRIVTGIRGAR